MIDKDWLSLAIIRYDSQDRNVGLEMVIAIGAAFSMQIDRDFSKIGC